MTFDKHKNEAYSTVATTPSPATSGTTLVVQGGDGIRFPTPPFNATVWPIGVAQPIVTNSEIIRVTAIPTCTIAVASNGAALPQATITVSSTTGFPSAGTITVPTSGGNQVVTYTGVTGTTFTGCTGGGGTMSTGGVITSDQLTIARLTGTEPNNANAARSIIVGDQIANSITVKLLTDIEQTTKGADAILVAASNAQTIISNRADYVCTGTNDDLIIAPLIAAGKRIVLSDGDFFFGTEVNIAVSNFTLEGQGSATIIHVANSANIRSAIALTGAIMNAKLRRFVIDGNKANQSSGVGVYIKLLAGSGDSDNVYEDLLIQNCKDDALKIDTGNADGSQYFLRVHCRTSGANGFNDLSLTDSVYDQCIAETNGKNGFYVGGVDNHYSNCKAFYNGSLTGNYHGYYIAGYNNYFDTCEAQDNYQSGFYSQNDGDATYGAQNCVFVNCPADSNNQSLSVLYGNGFQLKNVTGWMLIGCQAFVRPYDSGWKQKFGISLEGTTQQTQITNLVGSGNIGAPAPGVASAATAAGTTLGIGVYKYKITFVTTAGETQGGTEFSITTTTSNTNVSLTAIPVGGSGVLKRKIYRTQVGGATGTEKLVTTLNDNTTTTYTDNNSDASITGNAAVPTSNTTALLYLNAASGSGNVLYGLNEAGTRIATDAGGNDLEWDNMPELFWNRTNPDISLFSASDNRLDILNAGGGKGNLNTQNILTFGYGDYLGVSPTTSWPSGTHKLIEVGFDSTDFVKIYTPGSVTAAKMIELSADQKLGFFAATRVSKQTSGADLTNNITAGGTTDTITNWTSLTTYSTDAAAIRNAVYQLARKLKQINDGLRAYGLFT